MAEGSAGYSNVCDSVYFSHACDFAGPNVVITRVLATAREAKKVMRTLPEGKRDASGLLSERCVSESATLVRGRMRAVLLASWTTFGLYVRLLVMVIQKDDSTMKAKARGKGLRTTQ